MTDEKEAVHILQQEATQLARQQEVDRVLKLSTLDPFAILQIPQTSTTLEIKAAYRTKSRLIHPDKTAHPQARQAFERLKAAETDLMDEEKRSRMLKMIEEARRELQSEWRERTWDKGEFEEQVMVRYKKIMVELEWRRRQKIKKEMAREGELSRREEEMVAEKRKRREMEKAWEESRDERVSSWRSFQAKAGSSKKKKNKKKE
ncbi:DnaJ domain-containing protein [Coemansia asiatica]|uniref:DnaJ domain-containing protein n=1 Tax=Coemansia asiatica TaxID=1052880 RepID=A0A9W7XPY5_9FUNG|nr:DnaJ domain-containing protein [Coemansia asiatica]